MRRSEKSPTGAVLAYIHKTVVGRVTTKAYDIGFVYFRKSRIGRYKSRCTIVGNQGNLQYFDRLLNDSEEQLIDSSKGQFATS